MNQLKSSMPKDSICPIILVGTHKDAVVNDDEYLNKIYKDLTVRFPKQMFVAFPSLSHFALIHAFLLFPTFSNGPFTQHLLICYSTCGNNGGPVLD